MREKIDNIGGRKVLIFLLSIAIAVGTSFFMDLPKYREFLNFIVISCGVFFFGNGIEHISGAMGKRK